MILNIPEISLHGTTCRISCLIETENKNSQSFNLWYEFPRSYQQYLSKSMDAFLVAGLLKAMRLKEMITVHGSPSQLLLSNLDKFQKYFASWFPNQFSIIKIIPDDIRKPHNNTNEIATLSAFSGGVDSFYTLYKNLITDNQKKITHILFIHGFDISIHDQQSYDSIKSVYENMAKTLGIELLPVKTNYRYIFKNSSLSWDNTHGLALVSIAHLFSPLFSNFFIPSSHTLPDLTPYGTHPHTDPLLSSENLKIIHDSPIPRTSKIQTLADWDIAYDHLRVCWENPTGLQNCCACDKCLRTMTVLEIEGKLDKFTTFPHSIDKAIPKWTIQNNFERTFAWEVLNHSLENNKTELARRIEQAINKRKPVRKFFKKSKGLYRLLCNRYNNIETF